MCRAASEGVGREQGEAPSLAGGWEGVRGGTVEGGTFSGGDDISVMETPEVPNGGGTKLWQIVKMNDVRAASPP